MKGFFGGITLATLLLINAAMVSPAHAGILSPPLEAPHHERQGPADATPILFAALSLQDAIRLAQRRVGGRVLSATPVQGDGITHYRIKLIQGNGRIVTLLVDGSNGHITEG